MCKIMIFCDVMSCSLRDVCQQFGWKWYIHFTTWKRTQQLPQKTTYLLIKHGIMSQKRCYLCTHLKCKEVWHYWETPSPTFRHISYWHFCSSSWILLSVFVPEWIILHVTISGNVPCILFIGTDLKDGKFRHSWGIFTWIKKYCKNMGSVVKIAQHAADIVTDIISNIHVHRNKFTKWGGEKKTIKSMTVPFAWLMLFTMQMMWHSSNR